MSDAVVKTNFQGLMGTIKKSKHRLAPVYEAMTNALEATLQKQYNEDEKPLITVVFDFATLIEDHPTLNYITVSDNGKGFDEENFGRFETLLDKSKGYNNRGSGRIQFLHRFSRVDVESFYQVDGKHVKKTFSCSGQKFVYDETLEDDVDKNSSGSILTFLPGDQLDEDRNFYNGLIVDDVVRDIKRHFLLRFYLEKESGEHEMPLIRVVFSNNGEEKQSVEIKQSDIPNPTNDGELKVSYVKLRNSSADDIEWDVLSDKSEVLKWAHFKLPADDLSCNALYLCSKGVPVEPLPYDIIKKNEALEGQHYLTVFYGDVLDNPDNVSDSVDSFLLPDQKTTEDAIKQGDLFLPEQEFLFKNNITESAQSVISNIYSDVEDRKKIQEEQIEKLAREHGISLEIARQANIRLGDDEHKITDKMYQAQAKVMSRGNQKIQKLFKDLEALNPMDKNYQDELESKSSELLNMIPQQNKEELGRYIIRREMVAEILRKILARELDYQQIGVVKGKKRDKEGLIHDLLFKRKSDSTSELNDLWVLSEEYLHFDGCSELPINQMLLPDGQKLLKEISDDDLNKYALKTNRRPDIFLYAEEGKCIVIELKEPDVDLTDHLNQMTKYCNLIANFSTVKLEKFYCYLIGDNINEIDLPGDYHPTVNGDWVKTDLPIRSIKEGEGRKEIATSKIEVVKLSSIYEKAHRRNKSFADKLGLRDLCLDGGEMKEFVEGVALSQ